MGHHRRRRLGVPFLQQNDPAPIGPGDGALVGFLAGVAGAFIYLVLSIPINILLAPMEQMMLDRLSQMSDQMPADFRSYMSGPIGSSIRLMIGFMFMLCVGSVFSTLGGLLGSALFRKKPAAPKVIDIPPGT